MNFKQAVIDNAWGGINLDYGLLHLQLATPLTVLVFILVMIFVLNRLFFQPVLRTLDLRRKKIDESHKQSELLKKEVERMKIDFDQNLKETRKSVMEIHQSERNLATSEIEEIIQKEHHVLEAEMIKQTKQLQQEFAIAQKHFLKLSKDFSIQVSERLLN